MADITDYLAAILAARFGPDVRQAMHDAIKQVYHDGHAGAIDLEAREEIEALRAAVGSPLTAATSADMTDTDRIYVYVGTTGGGYTNGNWYYYDGSAWTSGGVYNSYALETDKTLLIDGAAADAKVAGRKLGFVSGLSSNLFDPYTWVNGWYNNSGALTQQTNKTYAISDFVEIKPDTVYRIQADGSFCHAFQIAWFAADETFIQRDIVVSESAYYTELVRKSPSNARYARSAIYTYPTYVTTENILSHHVMFTESAVAATYVPANTAADSKARSDAEKKFGSLPKVNIQKTRLWDAADWEQGNIRSDNGILDPYATNRICSGYMGLEKTTVLSVYTGTSYNHRVSFYRENEEYISTTQQTTWRSPGFVWEIPTGAALFRVSVKKTDDSAITPTVDTECVISTNEQREIPKKSALYGKRISILGDSLSTYAGIDNWNTDNARANADGTYCYAGNLCRYPQFNLLQSVRNMYWYRLLEDYDMILGVNESYAGAPVYSAQNLACSSMYRIGHLGDNGTPDIILVNAGTNDIGQHANLGTFNTENPANYTEQQILALNVGTFADAYRAMIIRLQYYYPNSYIVAMLPNYTTSYYTPDKADEYNEMIKTICDYFGVFIVDTRTAGITMFNKANYMPDGIHYNAAGMEKIYYVLKNKLAEIFDR